MRSSPPLLISLMLLLGGARESAPIQDTRVRLQKVQEDIALANKRRTELDQQAKNLEGSIAALTDQMVSLASTIQKNERQLSELEPQLVELERRHKAEMAYLAVQQKDVAHLLAALQQLTRKPPGLLLLQPHSAIETARAAGILTAVLPALERRATELKKGIQNIERVQKQLLSSRTHYTATLALLTSDRQKLDQLRQQREADRSKLLSEVEGETEKLNVMAREAKDIQDLLARLDTKTQQQNQLAKLSGPRIRPPDLSLAPKPEANGKLSSQIATRPSNISPDVPLQPPQVLKGTMRLPVQGTIIQSFGVSTEGGSLSKGILIRTRANAQVIAPSGGRIVFAGPFRGYGQLLIIAHGGGYHSLLAGMTRIDERVGEAVQAGEPVGIISSEDGQEPQLYLELRQKGQAINPLPWLTSPVKRSEG